MTELKIPISDELKNKMKEHPEINWASKISSAIENYLKNLEIHADIITSKELEDISELSLKVFLENEPDIYTDQDLIKRYNIEKKSCSICNKKILSGQFYVRDIITNELICFNCDDGQVPIKGDNLISIN